MLVLTRKLMEKVYIGDKICVTVVRLEGGQVRLGIDAPREISVVRAELVDHDRDRELPKSLRGMTRGDSAETRTAARPTNAATAERRGGDPEPGMREGRIEPGAPAGGEGGLRPQPSSARGSGIRRRGPSR